MPASLRWTGEGAGRARPPTPSSWVAGRSAPGAPGSCAGAAPGTWCCSRRPASGRARAAGRRASCGARAERRQPSISPSGPAASTSASARARHRLRVRAPVLLPAVPSPTVTWSKGRVRLDRDAAARSASTCAGSSRDEADAMNPTMAPRLDARWHLTSPGTATSTRRATSSPTPPRCPRPASTYASAPPSAGWSSRAGGSPPSGPRAGRIATGTVVLTGGPELAAVGRLVGVRIPAGGVRHQVAGDRAAPGSRPVPAADGLRRRCRPLLAARGRWAALRHEQPRRAPGRRPRGRLAVPGAHGGRGSPGWSAVDPGARAAQGVGRHDRLHARPPADPRPGDPTRRTRSPGPRSPRRAVTG